MKAIEHLAAKRRKWVEANQENGFDKGLKRLLTDLYPDNAHFIYELLQNAEDAHAQEVRFILHENRIEFEHDGEKLFKIKDVDAITSIGFSTKRDDVTNIGKFGVGFKAVFAYTETPEVESGEFYFRIRDMVVPEPIELIGSRSRDKKTRFVLPFDNPKKTPTQAKSEIERLLMNLGATTLLFLSHIRNIKYFLPDSSMGYIQRINISDSRFEIRVQHPQEIAFSSSWFLKFDKDVQVEDEDEEAETENKRLKRCLISVAFGLSRAESKTSGRKQGSAKAEVSAVWELTPMNPGRVCVYFPADKETSNLRFHLHAPFASTVARDSVRDCSGNYLLRDHLADLLAESMSAIRDQDLLSVRALALLPNDKDNLSKFYQPFVTRLVREFQEHNLVPMKRGGHAAANGIFRGSKALSDLIDDDDMLTLLGEDYFPPMWVANPSQRNQREDTFLSMLDIEQWDTVDLVKTLGRQSMDDLGRWMGGKEEKWHQNLYEILFDFFNAASKYPSAAAEDRKSAIKRLCLVRCSDAIYRKGSECFFATVDFENDGKFPHVAKGVYFASNEENKNIREFLEDIGVRKIDEQVVIETILEAQYAYGSDHPNRKMHFSNIRQFMRFLKENPESSTLFAEARLFMVDGKKGIEWDKPSCVYLDLPFLHTGLSSYYETKGVQNTKRRLSSVYEKSGINTEKIVEFAKKLGVTNSLLIEETVVDYNHPEWNYLNMKGGERYTACGIDKDYHIPVLKEYLVNPSIIKSKLVWQTMKEKCVGHHQKYLKAHFGRNASYIAIAESTLVHELRKAKWVPQEISGQPEFVQPRDAVAEKLPEGFAFQTDWEWLKALEFGLGAKIRLEIKRREKEHQSQEYKRKEEVAKEFGFNSPEEAAELARLKKENPDEFMKFKESISARNLRPTFPTRPVANPERRQERLGEQLTEMPDKEYEKRERSVRTTSCTIDPTTWLRNQYTYEADQMVCQICKEEMPFRKRDGTHYFEKKEILSIKYLSKEHEAQYLALCPLCAAKFEYFVKNDDSMMSELKSNIFSGSIMLPDTNVDVEISLGNQKTSIRFTETHFRDLKNILG